MPLLLIRSFINYLLPVEEDSDMAMLKVKHYVAEHDQLDVNDFSLWVNHAIVSDATLLSSLPEDVSVAVHIALKAGKVHGRLSQAGKVRNATPFVAPNENKKKARTGRAKRRDQYNKRFVTQVGNQNNQQSRQRGPNAQR